MPSFHHFLLVRHSSSSLQETPTDTTKPVSLDLTSNLLSLLRLNKTCSFPFYFISQIPQFLFASFPEKQMSDFAVMHRAMQNEIIPSQGNTLLGKPRFP